MRPGRRSTSERQASLASTLGRLNIDVVDDFHVICGETERHDDDSAPRNRVDPVEQIGLEPHVFRRATPTLEDNVELTLHTSALSDCLRDQLAGRAQLL